VESVTLTDSATGAVAKILVGFGFNCYEFRVQHAGKSVDLLWSAPGFETGQERASGSGIPLLFPFAGRIPGTTFCWEERKFQLQAGDGRGNAIHGFVLDRPWRVVSKSGSAVTGEFQASVDDPPLLDCWPADFRIAVTYELEGNCLKSRIEIANPDSQPLPCGLGTHPYFCLPLGGTRAEECQVRLPVTERWELVDMLPTGKRLQVAEAETYAAGAAFQSLTLDEVFCGLRFANDKCCAEILDPGGASKLQLLFDRAFRECVVYTPPHREAICIEPYTSVPGAFDLQNRGIDAGLKVLAPGETFQGTVEMRFTATQ
jgi:aldose 1-epimerase